MQLQLVYQHHPSKIPKLNIKSVNMVVIMVTYIFEHFEMIRYILKNIPGTSSMVSYIHIIHSCGDNERFSKRLTNLLDILFLFFSWLVQIYLYLYTLKR